MDSSVAAAANTTCTGPSFRDVATPVTVDLPVMSTAEPPHTQPSLDGDIVEVWSFLPQAIGDNQIAFKHSVLDTYRAPHQNRVSVGAGEITGIVDALEDIAHDLRHLRTGDLALGVQPSIMVAALHHGLFAG